MASRMGKRSKCCNQERGRVGLCDKVKTLHHDQTVGRADVLRDDPAQIPSRNCPNVGRSRKLEDIAQFDKHIDRFLSCFTRIELRAST